MKRPAFQFYPGDWLRATELRSCSVGARGLWIDMICLMHEGSPYGYLKVGSKVILPANLARMVGATLPETEGWLAELEHAEVFSRDESGCPFSRRMVRDEQIRSARASGGILGGNPALKTTPQKVNLPPNLPPTPASASASAFASASKTLNPLSDSAAPKSDADLLGHEKPHVNGYAANAKDLLEFLNKRTEHSYRPTPLTLKPIIARLKEGYTVSECRAVIVRRWRAWKDDEKMREFLRPATLFGGEKFAQYVGEVPAKEDQPG